MLSGKQIGQMFKPSVDFEAFVQTEMDAMANRITKKFPKAKEFSTVKENKPKDFDLEKAFLESVKQVF